MNRKYIKKLSLSLLTIILLFETLLILPRSTSAATTIPVSSTYTHHFTYQWCQHSDGHWSGGTAADGIVSRLNDVNQPKNNGQFVKIRANFSAPTSGWKDANGNPVKYSDLATTPTPSSGDFKDAAAKSSTQGTVSIESGSVFVKALNGKGILVGNGAKSNPSICGTNPGFEYLMDINVTWISTVTVADVTKFLSLEIDPTYKSLTVGQTQQFLVYANWNVNGVAKKFAVSNDKLTWKSDQNSYATVSAKGIVSAIKKTTTDAKITATFNEQNALVSANVKVLDKPLSDPGTPSGDFDIIPSNITYGDSFALHPNNISIPASCTFKSIKFKIVQGTLSYDTTPVTSQTSDTTFSLSNYPPVITSGKSHAVTMTLATSCGNVDVGPKPLVVQAPGTVEPPPPDPANNPPYSEIAWLKHGTQEFAQMENVGNFADLRTLKMEDPDGDPVHIVSWDFTQSSEWLSNLPTTHPITGIAPGYDGITLSEVGIHTVYMTVEDSKGAQYTAQATVGVISPYPVAIITGSTRVKEGRQLPQLLSGSKSYSPIGKPLVEYNWTNKADMYPTSGEELVTLQVKDSEGRLSNVAEHSITVIPDEPPIALLVVTAEETRLGTIRVQSASYSIDGDNIISHKFEMKRDVNNNGFSDDSWSIIQTGASDFYSFAPTRIGKYLFKETVCEDFGLCANTDAQPEEERTSTVLNLAPTVDVTTSSLNNDLTNKTPVSMQNLFASGSYYSLDTNTAATNKNWKTVNGALQTLDFKQLKPLISSGIRYSDQPFGYGFGMITNTGFEDYISQSPYANFQNTNFTETNIMSFNPYSDFVGATVDNESLYVLTKTQNIPKKSTLAVYNKKTLVLEWQKDMLNYSSVYITVKENTVEVVSTDADNNTNYKNYFTIMNKKDGSIVLDKPILPGYAIEKVIGIPNGYLIKVYELPSFARKTFIINTNGDNVGELPDGNFLAMSSDTNTIMMINWSSSVIKGYDATTYIEKFSFGSDTYSISNRSYALLGTEGNIAHMVETYAPNYGLATIKIFDLRMSDGVVIHQADIVKPADLPYSTWYEFTTKDQYYNGEVFVLGIDTKHNYWISTTIGGHQRIHVVDKYGNVVAAFDPFGSTGLAQYPRLLKMFMGSDGIVSLIGHLHNTDYKHRTEVVVIDTADYVMKSTHVGTVFYDIAQSSGSQHTYYPYDDQSFLIVEPNDKTYTTTLNIIKTTGALTTPKKFELGAMSMDLILGQTISSTDTLQGDITFTSPTAEGAGFVFKAQNNLNYYSAEWEAGQFKIKKTVGGVSTTVFSKVYGIFKDQIYTLRVVPKLAGFDVYINGLKQTYIADTAWLSGKMGMIDRGQAGVSYKNVIIESAGEASNRIAGTVLLGEPIDYTITFEDPELDPRLIARESWNYTHNPNIFLQPTGIWNGTGVGTTAAPVTIFDQTGEYTYKFISEDDANPDYPYPAMNFDAVRQKSNEVIGKIRVHRKPIACFTATLNADNSVSYTDCSYDPDRYNPATGVFSTENTGIAYATNHGVITTKYRYRQEQSSSYIEGKPTLIIARGTYVIDLAVQDEYGAWSDWATQSIKANGIDALPPNPGFTINPTSTYRNIPIAISSTANDPQDGARENIQHTYYVKNLTTSGPEIFQSYERTDWNKIFNSLGLFQFRQVVINSAGLSAETTRTVNIINRKPITTVTTPSSQNNAAPTIFDTKRPTFNWTYADADLDVQNQYHYMIYRYDGSLITSSISSGSAPSFTMPTDLPENLPMYINVRTFDGYEWGNWSAAKFFKIITNQPPIADFIWSPNPAYEGDNLSLVNHSSDPDGDLLSSIWTITGPGNFAAVTGTSENLVIPGGSTVNNPGVYTVKLTVHDPEGASASVTKTIVVRPLGIQGAITHTEAWETNRIRYNTRYPNAAQRASDWFWAGEAFVLEATVTDTGVSLTKPISVRAAATPQLQKNLTATPSQLTLWKGLLREGDTDISFVQLSEGPYAFVFTVTYSNGVTKTVTVTIHIVDTVDDYVQVHRIQ
jgi:hypothetical protein